MNTASQAGLTPVPGWLASYSMTKFAVVGLSLALRSAGADFGVRVTAVCPGWTDTPILDKLGPEDLPIPPSVTRAPSLRSMLAENHMSIYSPDRLATDILNGMRKNKAVIAAPRTTRAQWWFWRLAPEM